MSKQRMTIWMMFSVLISGHSTSAFGTVDILAKTYQPLYSPQEEESIRILPSYFLTYYASPDIQIQMISAKNILLKSDRFPGRGDANLASLAGLSVEARNLKHGGPISVTINMRKVQKPPISDISTTRVLEATVRCIILIAKEHGHTELHIKIKGPREGFKEEWRQFQKSYDLTEKEATSLRSERACGQI